MVEVKDKNVKSWAKNFVEDIETNSEKFEATLEKKKLVGLLKESAKIIKRLLEEV